MLRNFLLCVGLIASALSAASAATLDVKDEPLADVVSMLAQQMHQNITVEPSIETKPVTMHLENMSAKDLLSALEETYGLRAIPRGSFTILVDSRDFSVAGSASAQTAQVAPGNGAAVITLLKAAYPALTAVQTSPSTLLLTGNDQDLAGAHSLIQKLAITKYDTIPVTYERPSDLLATLQKNNIVDAKTLLSANDQAGELVFQGTQDAYDALKAAVAAFDQPPRRAYFKVQVLEYSPTESSHIGVLWGSPVTTQGGGTQVQLNPGSTTTAFVNSAIPLAATINAMVTSGTAKILADPGIGFNSAQKGSFNFTTLYPIQIGSTSAFVGGSTEYKPIGITLDITGVVGTHNEITVALSADDSTIDGFDSTAQHNPIIGDRKTTSTITVYPNEALVLAGYQQTQDTDILTRVPFLSNIPVLGELFKDRQRTHEQLKLAFIITPAPVETKGSL